MSLLLDAFGRQWCSGVGYVMLLQQFARCRSLQPRELIIDGSARSDNNNKLPHSRASEMLGATLRPLRGQRRRVAPGQREDEMEDQLRRDALEYHRSPTSGKI